MELITTKSFKLAVFTRGNKNAKRLALLVPGRLDTKDYANFPIHADYLAKHGFFAVAFDPPGTWESPGGTGLVTTTNYIRAINELIDYFGNRPTLLLGHSRGGASAILASSNPAVIGIVAVMAAYGDPTAASEEDVQRGFKVSYRDLPPGTARTEEKKKFELPIAYWEDGKKYNIDRALKECTKPKLLIYGTEDEFTSPDEVKDLYHAIPEPKMIKEIESMHDYRLYPKAIEETNKAIGEFLDKYL